METPRKSDQAAFAEEPTIVVGLGRCGLGVLERLGQTWRRVRDASEDPRLANLRLLHVRGEHDADDAWRAQDADARRLSDEIGEGDAPLRALDFLFLRSLGLVRFFRGMYQIALARDFGVVLERGRHPGAASEDEESALPRRLRTFEWRDLNPDIERAVEILRLEIARDPELELFLVPFLERIRAGQSPQIVADAIVRASHYAEGRDPSPWPMLGDLSDDPGWQFAEVREGDWAERALLAGVRAPRRVHDEIEARGLAPSLRETLSTRLREPASLSGLDLDEALQQDRESGEPRDAAGRGALGSLALVDRLVRAGDLARHVEHDHARSDFARPPPGKLRKHQALHARLSSTLAEVVEHGRVLSRTRDELRRLRAPSLGALVELADVDDAPGLATLRVVAAGDPTLTPALLVLDEAATQLGTLAELRAELARELVESERDLRTALRAEIDLGRSAALVAYELVACLERVPTPADAGHCRAHGLLLRGASRYALETGRLAASRGATLVAALEADPSADDAELLAARLQRAEVAAELDGDDLELSELLRVRGHTVLARPPCLARSRQLVAACRLARLHERRGSIDDAMRELASVRQFPLDSLVLEHRACARAHQIVAAHALGRLLGAQRRNEEAKEALTEALELAISALRTSGAPGAPLTLLAAHRPVIDRHAILIEHELVATLLAMDAIEEAIARLSDMLERRRSSLGWEHPDTLGAAVDLAVALRRRGGAGPCRALELLPRASAGAGGATVADAAAATRLVDAVRAGHAPGSRFDPLAGHESAFDPRALLQVPWESAGWSARATRADDGYAVVELPLWLHGFYDALDDDTRRQDEVEALLGPKLVRFGEQCYRGLLDLFWELRNRERPPAADDEGLDEQARRDAEALAQSTDLIAEVLWRRAKERRDAHTPFVPTAVEAFQLAELPSGQIRALRAPGLDAAADACERLDRRLAELGALPGGVDAADGRIFAECELAKRVERPRYEHALRLLRARIREVVASLLDTRYLSATAQRSVGRAPRVQVYLVGDLGEPFVRAAAWDVTALLHAELFRAFRSVFKEFRGGYGRNLCIVPVLWFPNPSAAAPRNPREAKDFVVSVRHEEAAMLDAVLAYRRAVFRLPNQERFIPVVYLCSRVNDGGVVSMEESMLQTHDFISLCTRGALGADDWLRSIMTGPYGRDPFGTFGCVELELPVERMREYLAGRLARSVLGELLQGQPSDPGAGSDRSDERDGDAASLAPLEARARAVDERLSADCESLAAAAAGPEPPRERELDPDAVAEEHSEQAAEGVAKVILDGWGPLVAEGCAMDDRMDELRRTARRVGRHAVGRVRERSDATVAAIPRRGELAPTIQRLASLASAERARLDARDRELDAARARALSETLPDPARTVDAAFAGVRDAAASVPRRGPMILALTLLFPLGLAASSAAAIAAAVSLELPRDAGATEWLLTRAAPWVGAASIVLAAHLLLLRHRRARARSLREEIARATRAVRDVVTGDRASILSFLGSRVSFMTALIRRGVAAMAEEQARVDAAHGRRIRTAAEVAERDLRRHAEDLGARTSGLPTFSAPPVDDLGHLLVAPGRGRAPLVDPEDVIGYSDDTLGPASSQRTLLPDVLIAAAPIGSWRDGLWFARRDGLLATGRERFAALLAEQSCEHPRFAPRIASRVDELSRGTAAQLGFPGYLEGAEGLDDDGVLVLARSDLVLRPRLAQILPKLRSDIKLRVTPVRAHAAYLLTLAQGIAPNLPLLHRRHMSRHENPWRPPAGPPIHVLTGMSGEIDAVFDRFERAKGRTSS